MAVVADADLYARLREVLNAGWFPLPDYPGYRGTGGPGKVLEELLDLDGGSHDLPDAGKWEIKFHSPQTNLLTLFHLEGKPTGHMHHMVREFGWLDSNFRTSFRHTIHRGHSSIGFYVANESGRITVRHPNVSDIAWPYWTHDRLISSFVSKLRRLIAVRGRKRHAGRGREVCYVSARLYWEPQAMAFVELVANGTIAIDFDARTNNGSGLRNHGTKFRIALDDLHHLYNHGRRFD